MKNKKIWIIAGSAAALVLVGGGVAFAATDGFEQDDTLTGSALDRASEAALDEVGEGTVTDAERTDDAGIAYSVEVLLGNGTEVDVALDEDFAVVRTDRDDAGTSAAPTDDSTATVEALTEQEIADASAAALAEVDGTVTDIDRSDDADHAYEVEVTLADGTDVDVELDDAFAVVRVDDDSQR